MKETEIEVLRQIVSRTDKTGNEKVEMLVEFVEQQLKNCNLQNVSNNEVAVCDCSKGKFVFNEVKQELICGCGRRIKITN